MIVKSDQLCCYLEGVAVPLSSITFYQKRNSFNKFRILIPIADFIVPKMWANALVQVTYIENKNGTRQEKLLFEGICISLDVQEQISKLELIINSKWDIFNLNTTLDYTSPKRYGIQRLEDGVVIHLGPESDVVAQAFQEGYKLSGRYFWTDLESETPDILKLQYIANFTPFAERYAFSLFEDIAFSNFLLTRVYAERFNLLRKSEKKKDIANQESKFSIDNINRVTK